MDWATYRQRNAELYAARDWDGLLDNNIQLVEVARDNFISKRRDMAYYADDLESEGYLKLVKLIGRLKTRKPLSGPVGKYIWRSLRNHFSRVSEREKKRRCADIADVEEPSYREDHDPREALRSLTGRRRQIAELYELDPQISMEEIGATIGRSKSWVHNEVKHMREHLALAT